MSYPYPVSVIPGPNDLLSLSQGQIQTNFANLIGWSGVDHVAYGDTNAGQHEQVTFFNVTSQATPTDPVAVLYTKNDSNTHPQLFFLNSQNSGFYIPSANGSTVLMGGIIMQWGSYLMGPSVTTLPVTFPRMFPSAAFSITFGTNGQPTGNAPAFIAGSLTQTGFTASRASGATPNVTYTYVVIGN